MIFRVDRIVLLFEKYLIISSCLSQQHNHENRILSCHSEANNSYIAFEWKVIYTFNMTLSGYKGFRIWNYFQWIEATEVHSSYHINFTHRRRLERKSEAACHAFSLCCFFQQVRLLKPSLMRKFLHNSGKMRIRAQWKIYDRNGMIYTRKNVPK